MWSRKSQVRPRCIGFLHSARRIGGVGSQRAKHAWQCGNECSEQDGTRRQSEDIRVGCSDLIEEGCNVARRTESECDTRATSERDHLEDIESDKANDAGTSRANRHADADLAAALEDGIVEDSVESDAGEEQRDGGKKGGEHGQQALANGLIADQIELGGGVGDAKTVVALRNELAKGVGEGERVLGVRVNHEGGEAFERGRGFAVDAGEGDVEDWAVCLAQVVVRDVGGDADDLIEGPIVAARKGAADGVPAPGK